MEHFPPSNTVPLTESEIVPHFAAQLAGNGAPNHGSSSHRITIEETTLGKEQNGQDRLRQIDGTNEALCHDVNNQQRSPQEDPQRTNKPQSAPTRTEITYPTLSPSPPAVPASEPAHPLPHLSTSYLCPTPHCGWKVAYLKLRRLTKKMMEEKEENVREFRWAVDDMERKMYSNANFLDELDGGWRGCESALDAKGDVGEFLRGVGDEVPRGGGSSAESPPRDGGNRVLDQVVYPDHRSDLSRLESEEDRLGIVQGMGCAVAPRSKSPPGVPPQNRNDGVLDQVVYPGLRSELSRPEKEEDRLGMLQGIGDTGACEFETSAKDPPRDGGDGVLDRVVYPDLPSVAFGGERVVDSLA